MQHHAFGTKPNGWLDTDAPIHRPSLLQITALVAPLLSIGLQCHWPQAAAPSGRPMDIRAFIERARHEEPSAADIMAFCEAFTVTPERFCNLFAKAVAIDFLAGQTDFDQGDQAMNFLFVFMTNPLYQSQHGTLPEPAWSIYLAFDRGEYLHPEHDQPSDIPSEKYTRPELVKLLAAQT